MPLPAWCLKIRKRWQETEAAVFPNGTYSVARAEVERLLQEIEALNAAVDDLRADLQADMGEPQYKIVYCETNGYRRVTDASFDKYGQAAAIIDRTVEGGYTGGLLALEILEIRQRVVRRVICDKD